MLKSDKYIFGFKNLQNNDLNVLYSKINEYLKFSNLDISNDKILEFKKTIRTYNKLFSKIHNENKESGIYGTFDYKNIPIEFQNNLENDFKEVNGKLMQFSEIMNSYFVTYTDLKEETYNDLINFMKSKFNENDYNYFTRTISKDTINELEKIDRKDFKSFYEKFFMKASYHVSLAKKFDLAIKEWLQTYQGNFISYYNKKIYNMSINKNLKEIETKQKNEEDFFNKIGN